MRRWIFWLGHDAYAYAHAHANPDADAYPYAAFPAGVPANTSFFDFFGAQWAAVAPDRHSPAFLVNLEVRGEE